MRHTLRCGHVINVPTNKPKVFDMAEADCVQCRQERASGNRSGQERIGRVSRGKSETTLQRTGEALRGHTPELPVPDFTLQTPMISYRPPCGHLVWSRYAHEGKATILCMQCYRSDKPYVYTADDCKQVMPRCKNGSRLLSEGQIARCYDRAIIKNRIAKLITCNSGKVTVAYAKLVAEIVGCSWQTVYNVEKELWSYADWVTEDDNEEEEH